MIICVYEPHMGTFGDNSVPYGSRQGPFMNLIERIRVIREAEGFGQREFAEEIGMKLKTLKNYEQGLRETASSDQLELITNHPRFQKYTLWLMTETTLPEAGQISPIIEEERKRDAG